MNRFLSLLRAISVLGVTFALASCAAVQTSIEHRDLNVQTRMSESIILPPTSPLERTIWVDFRNTSDKDVEIGEQVRSCLAAKGYTLVADPKAAHYWLQSNVLAFAKADPSAAQQAFANGYGGALTGIATGGTIGALAGGYRGAAIGGLAGGVVLGLGEVIANSSVKNVTFAGITDVQISEQTNQQVERKERSSVRQGTSSVVQQSASSTSNQFQYRTRVVSTANKVNLDFAEAQPAVQGALAKSVCGLF